MTRSYQFLIWTLVCSMTWGNLLLAQDNPYEDPVPAPKEQTTSKPAAPKPAANGNTPAANAPKLAENPIRSVRILAEELKGADAIKALEQNTVPNIELIFDLSQANCVIDIANGKVCGLYFKAIKHAPNTPDLNLLEEAIKEHNAKPENAKNQLQSRKGLSWLDFNAATLKLFKEYNELWKDVFSEQNVQTLGEKSRAIVGKNSVLNGENVRDGTSIVQAAGIGSAAAVITYLIGSVFIARKARTNPLWRRFAGYKLVDGKVRRGRQVPIAFGLVGAAIYGGSYFLYRLGLNPLWDYLKFGDQRQERLWLSELMDTSQCYAEGNLNEYTKSGISGCLLGMAANHNRVGKSAVNGVKVAKDPNQPSQGSNEQPANAPDGADAGSPVKQTAQNEPLPEDLRDVAPLVVSPAQALPAGAAMEDKAVTTGKTQSMLTHQLPTSLIVGPDRVQFAETALKTFFTKYRRKYRDVEYVEPALRGPSPLPFEEPKK